MLARKEGEIFFTGPTWSAQAAMGMPNVEAMLSEVRGCVLSRKRGIGHLQNALPNVAQIP